MRCCGFAPTCILGRWISTSAVATATHHTIGHGRHDYRLLCRETREVSYFADGDDWARTRGRCGSRGAVRGLRRERPDPVVDGARRPDADRAASDRDAARVAMEGRLPARRAFG